MLEHLKSANLHHLNNPFPPFKLKYLESLIFIPRGPFTPLEINDVGPISIISIIQVQ